MIYRVLIVEDDPMVAMINEQYVQKDVNFCVVGSVRNGKDALDFLQKEKVDLVIMDVYMPIMNGVEVLKKIRQEKIKTDVIMVTAANDTQTLENTMNLGVVDYLIKPFALERFLVSLEKFLLKKSTLQDTNVLDQNSVDKIITNSVPLVKSNQNQNQKIIQPLQIQLPKGIQQKTLELICNFIESKSQNTYIDGEQISKDVGLSSVTVRHYMNYLVQIKKVTQTINYKTGGRPCILYKKV